MTKQGRPKKHYCDKCGKCILYSLNLDIGGCDETREYVNKIIAKYDAWLIDQLETLLYNHSWMTRTTEANVMLLKSNLEQLVDKIKKEGKHE